VLLLATLFGVVVFCFGFAPFCRLVFKRYVTLDLAVYLEVLGVIVLILLLICLIVIPWSRAGFHIEVKRYYALKQTLDNIRTAEEMLPQEATAIQLKVIEMNEDIAKWKFLAKSRWVSVFVPKKEILELDYLR